VAKLAGGDWVRCSNDACGTILFTPEYAANLNVCPKCAHHGRLTARERIRQLVDADSFHEHDAGLTSSDPLRFVVAREAYSDKLRAISQRTGERSAAVTGTATIDGWPVEVVVLDFAFMGASMGHAVGEKVARAAERAAAARSVLITVNSSGGARMHEGIYALLQMAKTVTALTRLGEVGVPHIAVLADPTLGGVTASYVGVGDVLIAEQGALIGFAGPRVIEQVIKQKLPPEAQRTAFLLKHGMVDLVVSRRELRSSLERLVRMYAQRRRGRGRPLRGERPV
jgi:acetyl-CoA carboxylase carboxyl transferase subunit beta